MNMDSAMDIHLSPSLDGQRDVRPSGETEIELASGEAANFLDLDLDLDPHEVSHRPYNGQNFTNPTEGPGLLDSSCFCHFDD